MPLDADASPGMHVANDRRPLRVGIVTLGCDKNTVDNEYLAGRLDAVGCECVPVPLEATAAGLDAVVITTCGFIGDAKQQSVDAIVSWTERKQRYGDPRRVFVAGCLAQRYAAELLNEIPAIDAIVGVGQFDRLAQLIADGGASTAERNAVNSKPAVTIYPFMHRRRLDRRPYTFLKISDGCDHACSFCSIPLMKGKHRSVTRDILIEEMRALVADGVKEFNLVAQDLADYGKDLHDGCRLPHLLRDLCAVDGDFWIRCLYLYPGGVTDEFLEVVATEPKIVPYIDMPLQHLDPDTMHLMKRPYREKNTFHLVKRMRAAVPGLTFRTTMIVGFPGETEDAHQRVLDGLRALRFNWVGAFRYSREEDTPAGQAPDQIPDEVKEERWHAVMELQSTITAEYNRARIGTSARVLVENFDETSNRWTGRSPSEAPEVDGSVLFSSDAPVAAGHFANVFITAAGVYDVMGRAT